jgi:hypothetical protein
MEHQIKWFSFFQGLEPSGPGNDVLISEMARAE